MFFMKGWDDMKRLILVLLVLVFSVPAGATVLVYNLKETCTGTEFDSGDWYSYKESWSGYLLIEQTGPDTAEVRVIWTWKEGKQKYAEAEDWGEIDFIPAALGNGKEVSIVSDADKEGRIVLTGASKMTKISAYKAASCDMCHTSVPGDISQKLPSSLTGYWIGDEKDGDPFTYRDLWTSKFALKLNAKSTLACHLKDALDVDDAADEILESLDEQGYYIDW
jgi:hypothetical protein